MLANCLAKYLLTSSFTVVPFWEPRLLSLHGIPFLPIPWRFAVGLKTFGGANCIAENYVICSDLGTSINTVLCCHCDEA